METVVPENQHGFPQQATLKRKSVGPDTTRLTGVLGPALTWDSRCRSWGPGQCSSTFLKRTLRAISMWLNAVMLAFSAMTGFTGPLRFVNPHNL